MSQLSNLLYKSFIPGLKTSFILLRLSFRRLSIRQLFADMIAVAASIGFVSIPAFLAGVVFLLLPQGRDTLILVVENMADGQYLSLIFLLASVTCWSLCSELGVRYAINISDNSGMNLSDDRVDWRKLVQRLFSAFFLLWPPILLIGGFIWSMLAADYITDRSGPVNFVICIVALLLLIIILAFLYFHKFGRAVPGRPQYTIFGRRSLPPLQQRWVDKLYGIYNDYIFLVPKPTNYQQPYSKDLKKFTENFTANEEMLVDFPQSKQVLRDMKQVPEDFILINAEKIKKGRGDFYKWQYRIPTGFYHALHKQVIIMAVISLLLVLILAMIPARSGVFGTIGAPALVCLALACYTGIYCGLLYLDKALLRTWKISVRFLLLILFVVTSFYNRDHPVRQISKHFERTGFDKHFAQWFRSYKSKFDASYGSDTSRNYPLIFICAEGGAFRTSAYASLFMTRLEEEMLKRTGADMRSAVFAMSGVSGGAVGLGFYNAVAFRDRVPVLGANTFSRTEKFFRYDSLSPLIGKMLYGEFLNLFILKHLERFDRAIALEQSWEQAYQDFIGDGGRSVNTYQADFILPDSGEVKPMLVINTTEIESGLQCWMSNIRPDSLRFADSRDLLSHKISMTRYSTAINFSSRFPLFSPAAEVTLTGRAANHGGRDTTYRLHYLDGGYVENTGSASMLEILEMIRMRKDAKHIIPIVITLLFSEEDKKRPFIHGFNDITEVINGIYNTRSGNARTSRDRVKELVKKWNNGVMVDAPLTPGQQAVPMNWVLSGQSMEKIKQDVISKLTPDGKIMQALQRSDIHFLGNRKIHN